MRLGSAHVNPRGELVVMVDGEQRVIELTEETQQTVSRWADETFGVAGSNARVAARANEEMAELLRALTADDRHPKAAEELADIVIVLYRVAERLGVCLHTEIDRKMAINRARVWRLDNTGHGYHVRPEKLAVETWSDGGHIPVSLAEQEAVNGR